MAARKVVTAVVTVLDPYVFCGAIIPTAAETRRNLYLPLTC